MEKLNKPNDLVFTMLVGTYTTGESNGIHIYRFNATAGTATFHSEIAGVENPSYLCISADNKYVYAVNEVDQAGKGGVSALEYIPGERQLQFINRQATTGAGPCYVSTDRRGRYLFTANYIAGSLSVFPLASDGSLQAEAQLIQDTGHSINPLRQEGPHVHICVLSPNEDYLFYTDLGTDKLNVLHYNGSLTQHPLMPAEPPFAKVPDGQGPRHLAFSLDAKFLYLVTEMGAEIYVYHFHNGALQLVESINITDKNFTGENLAADIQLSPDGNFLYVTNRGEANEVVVFAVNQLTGQLTFVQRHASLGKEPRSLAIDPTGNWLLVANQKSSNIAIFKRDNYTGKLSSGTGLIKIGDPSCIKFIGVTA